MGGVEQFACRDWPAMGAKREKRFMMKATWFSYISATILVVALVSHVGSSWAGAQGTATLVTVIDSATENPSHWALDSSGRLFYRDGSGWHFLAQCPAGRAVDLRVAPYHGNNYIVGMENGDVYTFPTQFPPAAKIEFTYLGNVFAGTVQAQSRPWGAVKREYRK